MRGKIFFKFHGGCNGCDNDISVCPGCQYMEPNWNLPDLNPEHARKEAHKQAMIRLARKLHISTDWIR